MRFNTNILAAAHRFAMRTLALLAVTVFALALVPATYADERAIGPNGGQIKDAGKYHLELVVKENGLTVYVTGTKDQKIETKGASGTATVLTGKNTASVKLESSGENALAGSGKFAPATDMKVVVSITLPGQAPIQARFTPLDKPKSSAKTAAK